MSTIFSEFSCLPGWLQCINRRRELYHLKGVKKINIYLYLTKTMELSLVHTFNNHQIYFSLSAETETRNSSNMQVSQGIPAQIFDATL